MRMSGHFVPIWERSRERVGGRSPQPGRRALDACALAEGRGIQQWRRDDTPLATVAAQAEKGEWQVAVARGAVRAALRPLTSDPEWPPDGVRACYVHGLMIDRSQEGTGLGARLLSWAADHARRAGAETLRLDCVETNVRLRQYYTGQGFRSVGRVAHAAPWHSVVLLERPI